MALLKWTAGDTITERSANNKSIRKGTEAEIAAIGSADRENGDLLYNTTEKKLEVQMDSTADERANLFSGFDADANEVTVTGTTALQRKDTSWVKSPSGINGNQITIIYEIKTDNNGTSATFEVHKDGGGIDVSDTSTATDYEIKVLQVDVSGDADGRHTLEFFIKDGSGDTVSLRELEVIYS